MIQGLQDGLEALRTDMNRGFASLERRFDAVDRRFDAVDRRFETIEGRFDRRLEAVDHRFEKLEDRISRQFVFLVGLQVMTLAAVVTSLATILGALAGPVVGAGPLFELSASLTRCSPS